MGFSTNSFFGQAMSFANFADVTIAMNSHATTGMVATMPETFPFAMAPQANWQAAFAGENFGNADAAKRFSQNALQASGDDTGSQSPLSLYGRFPTVGHDVIQWAEEQLKLVRVSGDPYSLFGLLDALENARKNAAKDQKYQSAFDYLHKRLGEISAAALVEAAERFPTEALALAKWALSGTNNQAKERAKTLPTDKLLDTAERGSKVAIEALKLLACNEIGNVNAASAYKRIERIDALRVIDDAIRELQRGDAAKIAAFVATIADGNSIAALKLYDTLLDENGRSFVPPVRNSIRSKLMQVSLAKIATQAPSDPESAEALVRFKLLGHKDAAGLIAGIKNVDILSMLAANPDPLVARAARSAIRSLGDNGCAVAAELWKGLNAIGLIESRALAANADRHNYRTYVERTRSRSAFESLDALRSILKLAADATFLEGDSFFLSNQGIDLMSDRLEMLSSSVPPDLNFYYPLIWCAFFCKSDAVNKSARESLKRLTRDAVLELKVDAQFGDDEKGLAAREAAKYLAAAENPYAQELLDWIEGIKVREAADAARPSVEEAGPNAERKKTLAAYGLLEAKRSTDFPEARRILTSPLHEVSPGQIFDAYRKLLWLALEKKDANATNYLMHEGVYHMSVNIDAIKKDARYLLLLACTAFLASPSSELGREARVKLGKIGIEKLRDIAADANALQRPLVKAALYLMRYEMPSMIDDWSVKGLLEDMEAEDAITPEQKAEAEKRVAFAKLIESAAVDKRAEPQDLERVTYAARFEFGRHEVEILDAYKGLIWLAGGVHEAAISFLSDEGIASLSDKFGLESECLYMLVHCAYVLTNERLAAPARKALKDIENDYLDDMRGCMSKVMRPTFEAALFFMSEHNRYAAKMFGEMEAEDRQKTKAAAQGSGGGKISGSESLRAISRWASAVKKLSNPAAIEWKNLIDAVSGESKEAAKEALRELLPELVVHMRKRITGAGDFSWLFLLNDIAGAGVERAAGELKKIEIGMIMAIRAKANAENADADKALNILKQAGNTHA